MNILRSKQRGQQGQVAVAVAGQLEPVEPAYMKPNMSSRPWDRNQVPYERVGDIHRAPRVDHGQRTRGMRYLWAHGAVRQPISPLGTGPDVGQAVWSSSFQPDLIGPIHDAGFNDALFQAGYPGFNLGLSFKVQTLQENATGGPGYNMKMRSPNITVTISPLRRNFNQGSNRG